MFMDIGCGDGFFTLIAAEIVGERGIVHAVDVNTAAIASLRTKASEKGLKNIDSKVGAAEQTVFCDGCADVVFYSIVLHDFKNPTKVLQNAKRMLKRSGKLVNLDWKKQAMPFGPPVQIRFSQEEASTLIKAAGFDVENVRDAGKYQYLITARP